MALRRRRFNKAVGDLPLPDESSKMETTPDLVGGADPEPQQPSESGKLYEELTPDEKTAVDGLIAKGTIQLREGPILQRSPFGQRVSDYLTGGSLAWD